MWPRVVLTRRDKLYISDGTSKWKRDMRTYMYIHIVHATLSFICINKGLLFALIPSMVNIHTCTFIVHHSVDITLSIKYRYKLPSYMYMYVSITIILVCIYTKRQKLKLIQSALDKYTFVVQFLILNVSNLKKATSRYTCTYC